jgi:divalent metal cation (Fe/Co/Zn/Cd) transporter
MIFEGFALRVAWQEFKHWRSTQRGSLWRALRDAKDLALPTVLFEDAAALLGLLIAAAGITATLLTHNGVYDGIASVLIGVILLGVACFLATESYSLLLGESAGREDRERIREIVLADPSVHRIAEMGTLQRGPESILVALTLEFTAGMTTAQIAEVIGRLEDQIRASVPEAKDIFVEVGFLRGAPQRS